MKATILFIFLSSGFFVIAKDLPPCARNNWRDYKKGKCMLKQANLTGLDLRGVDFRNVDLRWANLKGALLQEADLTGAQMIGADLSHSNLQGTDLTGALMSRVKVEGVDLRGVNLMGHITKMDLRGADLTGAIVTSWEAEQLKGRGIPTSKLEVQSGSSIDILQRRLVERYIKSDKERGSPGLQCSYILEPAFIKTKGCGGICSGVVKCERIASGLQYSASVTCESKGDDCPSAYECFIAKKPEKTFFVGTPSEYKEKYPKTENSKVGNSGATQSSKRFGHSGATQ